jgi:hypothetical protein
MMAAVLDNEEKSCIGVWTTEGEAGRLCDAVGPLSTYDNKA